jgi:opacity protein-like surface antigen
MKKLLMMMAMAILTMTATAQEDSEKTGFRYGGVLTGAMSSYSGDFQGIKQDMTFCYGGGLVAEYHFTPNVFLGTGLEFGLRGTKMEYAGGSTNVKSRNLIVPVNIGGRVNVSDKLAIYAQVGPYVSYAVKKPELQIIYSGTVKGEAFDWGFDGKVGVEIFRIFRVFGGYELGMKKVFADSKNRSIIFGVAYML